MRREILRGAAIGMLFSGASYAAVVFMGFGWKSLAVSMYLYVAMGVLMAFGSSSGLLDSRISELFDRVVIVAEGEELELRKLVSGEKYRVKGELEKL
ncbi:MAG: hypothetical protein ABEJ91_02870 [Candidatus Nanohaloarchaea archaeon]